METKCPGFSFDLDLDLGLFPYEFEGKDLCPGFKRKDASGAILGTLSPKPEKQRPQVK